MINQISYVVNAAFYIWAGCLLVSGSSTLAGVMIGLKAAVDLAVIVYIDKKTEEIRKQLEKELNGDTNTTSGN